MKDIILFKIVSNTKYHDDLNGRKIPINYLLYEMKYSFPTAYLWYIMSNTNDYSFFIINCSLLVMNDQQS